MLMHFSTIFAFVSHIRLGAQFYLIFESILEPFRSRAAMVFASKICTKKVRKTSAQKAVAGHGCHTFPGGGWAGGAGKSHLRPTGGGYRRGTEKHTTRLETPTSGVGGLCLVEWLVGHVLDGLLVCVLWHCVFGCLCVGLLFS